MALLIIRQQLLWQNLLKLAEINRFYTKADVIRLVSLCACLRAGEAVYALVLCLPSETARQQVWVS